MSDHIDGTRSDSRALPPRILDEPAWRARTWTARLVWWTLRLCADGDGTVCSRTLPASLAKWTGLAPDVVTSALDELGGGAEPWLRRDGDRVHVVDWFDLPRTVVEEIR